MYEINLHGRRRRWIDQKKVITMANDEDAVEALLAIAAGIAIGAGIVTLLEMLQKQKDKEEW